MREQGALWDAANDEHLFDVFAEVGDPEQQERISDGFGGTIAGFSDPGTMLVQPVDPADRARMRAAFDGRQLELRIGDRAVPCFFVRDGELRLAGAWFRRDAA
jgi:hypothetical protein